MTAVDFRCEQCGKLVNIEAEPGQEISCPHCQTTVVVPAALANLPRPQVPGGPRNATVEDAPAEGDVPPPEEELEEEAGFSPTSATTVAAVMPWMLSLFLHLGMGLILAFAGMMYVTSKPPDLGDIEIPGDTFNKNPGGMIQPGNQGVTRSSTQTEVQYTNVARSSGETVIKSQTGTGAGLMQAMGGSTGSGERALGVASSIAGSRSSAKFFGTSGGSNIHHLVFVIDRSGSMEVSESGGRLLNLVKGQMRQTIRNLKEVQTFHIIFFASGEPVEMDSRALIPATDANKLRAMNFLDTVNAFGRTDPLPGLKRAVAVLSRADPTRKGKQIFLLTDGDFPDNEAVKDYVKNNCKGIYVNTYLFGANTQPAIRDAMIEIAKATGGNFKAIGND